MYYTGKEKQRRNSNKITNKDTCFVLEQLFALSPGCVLKGQRIQDSRVHALPSGSGGIANIMSSHFKIPALSKTLGKVGPKVLFRT
jgi:hypothetical protein